MTTPLILQIQQALLDNSASLSEALRKAKVVCFKLGLTEFEAWVDSEMEGYMTKEFEALPQYRKLYGTPEAFSAHQGWQPINFQNAKLKTKLSLAPIGMTTAAIEESLRDTNPSGVFSFPYPPEIEKDIMDSLNWGPSQLRIRLTVPQVSGVLDKVRNILLGWTLEMEKQGILGSDLVFNEEDRRKSVQLTQGVVNHIHIGSVGSFVQSAKNSVVQGGVNSENTLAKGVQDLVRQVSNSLSTANLPPQVEEETRKALAELQEAEKKER